jgi:hypothetical protein
MIQLVPASLLHVGPLANRLRAIDREECEAMGRTPKDGLRIGLRTSLSAFTAIDDRGAPVAMLGVVSRGLISRRGLIWLLGTDEVYRNGRALLTIGPRVIAYWLETFETMENVVSVKNERAIRLLVRWGAHVGGAVQEHGGVSFVPFRFDRGAIQGQRRAA